MVRYIAKRLILIVPIILGVILVVFFILDQTPGDPGTIILGQGATQEAIDAMNESLGYHRHFFSRYLSYVADVFLRFDFGKSYRSGIPISKELISRLPISIRVSLNSILFACIFGIPLGILSAVKQYSLLDTLPTITALVLAAFPTFFMGMILLYFFSLKLNMFPSYGFDTLKHHILPMISLGLPEAGFLLRYTRSSMLETIRQDYIRTARAKGATLGRVVMRHALKNALVPIVTITGVEFAGLIGGACATEVLYSIPGLGSMVVNGVSQKDIPSVMGATVLLAVVCSMIVLCIDIIYAFIDPRIRVKYRQLGVRRR